MLCVFCVVIHRRVSAGAARPRRPPLREVVFFAENGVIALLFLARPRQRDTGKHSPRGFPAASASRLHFPDEAVRLPRRVFTPPWGVSDAISPRGRTRKDGKGVTGAVRQAVSLAAKERWHGRPRNAARVYCFLCGLPGHRYRRGRRQARPRGCCASALCVF